MMPYDQPMLSSADTGILHLDALQFAAAFARRPLAVDHTLVDHPLLELDAIAELADRFPGRIERHRGDQALVTPGGAAELDVPPSETVRGIDHNGCWMVFWYIEQDPAYKELLDRCLDEAESYRPRGAGATRQREGFLFLSAPNAVTPVHFDPEHNFLLQIRGHKDMNLCEFPSRENELRELERYYDGGHRNLEAMPSAGETVGLDPGRGVYVPPFMPHWVQNGPEASISLSITFRTKASLRAERVHTINSRLRRVGISPQPPGASRVRDVAKESLFVAAKEPARRLPRVKRALAGARQAPPAT